jgi:ribosomal protein S18 acetylase RimI-like enzyme
MGFRVRRTLPADLAACANICLKTGRYGQDGSADFPRDPEALSRIYTSPYIVLYPSLSLVLEDDCTGEIVGYCLAAVNTREHFRLFEQRIRPNLAARFPITDGAKWTSREQEIHALYHTPDYDVPSDSDSLFPSHLHIDLLPCARRQGFGRRMVRLQLAQLARNGSPGVHLSVSATNASAQVFYASLGFRELSRVGTGAAEAIFMGLKLAPPPAPAPPPIRGETNVISYLAGAGVAMACGDAVLGQTWIAVTQPVPWAVAEVGYAAYSTRPSADLPARHPPYNHHYTFQ